MFELIQGNGDVKKHSNLVKIFGCVFFYYYII